MNETIQNLVQRRSIRSYTSRQVEKEVLDQILLAGTYAPSGMGRQPAKIVVLQDAGQIAQLEKLNGRILGNEDSHPFYGAPTVLVVFADSRVFTYLEDGSLVMGNLMNAAHALGVGSCWIHRAKETFQLPEGKALMEKWGVDDSFVGIGHCILGYAAETPSPKPRKENVIVFP